MGLLSEALRRQQLDAEGVEKAGGILNRLLAGEARPHPTTDALVLGQCTTTWLANAVTAVAWGQGAVVRCAEGAYDNVVQEILRLQELENAPAVVVLVPWSQRLLLPDGQRSAQERVADECIFWRRACSLIHERVAARIVQVGYDWVTSGALGHYQSGREESAIGLVRRVNEELRQSLPASACFADLEQIAGVMGRERFYDPRRYYWTKQPFSEAGVQRLAEHIWAGMRALLTGPKKVLVLDLDNTLWGGVVGETGPLGVDLGEGPAGEAYRAFQNYVKALGQRGVVLTVCSKNNPADARGPFEQNPEMALSLDDFAHFEVSWEPKAAGLRRIAETLQLGLDSFVFFDDNPAEREHIRQALPEVEVVEVPTDPAEYIRALGAGLWFEAALLTQEDQQRVEQYRAQRDRRAAEHSFASMEDYLRSLDMVADIRPIDEADLDRVVQLIGKTNQFNLTTRRHSVEKVRAMLTRQGTIGRTMRLTDRFGDHGLISVLLAVEIPGAGPKSLEIDTWLMSCRVIGRTAEEYFVRSLLREASAQDVQRLVGRYIPTSKNELVKDLYDRLGFRRCPGTENGVVVYDLDLSTAAVPRTLIRGKDEVVS
jgi:FkbH-like protein